MIRRLVTTRADHDLSGGLQVNIHNDVGWASAHHASSTRLIGIILLACLAAAPAPAQDLSQTVEPTQAQPTLPKQRITIVSSHGARHVFEAEMAVTPQEQRTGLEFRTAIAPDSGMFFDWGTPRPQSMWMQNCPVPEDMVFIGADGRVAEIAEDTVPESLAEIGSGGPVRATLELKGGTTEKLGISVGDRVYGPIFGPPPGLPDAGR